MTERDWFVAQHRATVPVSSLYDEPEAGRTAAPPPQKVSLEERKVFYDRCHAAEVQGSMAQAAAECPVTDRRVPRTTAHGAATHVSADHTERKAAHASALATTNGSAPGPMREHEGEGELPVDVKVYVPAIKVRPIAGGETLCAEDAVHAPTTPGSLHHILSRCGRLLATVMCELGFYLHYETGPPDQSAPLRCHVSQPIATAFLHHIRGTRSTPYTMFAESELAPVVLSHMRTFANMVRKRPELVL